MNLLTSKLPPVQKKFYEYLFDHWCQTGKLPSSAQCMEYMNWKSRGSLAQAIQKLIKKGYLKRVDDTLYTTRLKLTSPQGLTPLPVAVALNQLVDGASFTQELTENRGYIILDRKQKRLGHLALIHREE